MKFCSRNGISQRDVIAIPKAHKAGLERSLQQLDANETDPYDVVIQAMRDHIES